MAHFYLIDTIESTIPGALVILDGPEGRHASTVSRIRVGESLLLGNGRGLVISGTVTESTKDVLTLRVDTVENFPLTTPRITLVQALAKTDRDERAVEASTELGVDSVIAWAADRSVSRWDGPKVAKGLTRWSTIAKEASKQSMRPYLPRVESHSTSRELGVLLAGQHIVVLDPTGDSSLGSLELDDRDLAIVVGPEGGITPAELSLFRDLGASIVTVGSHILRTSTAGPAALAILNGKLGRC